MPTLLADLGILGFGFLYPSWQTIVAITRDDAPGQVRWLKYWGLFGLLCAAFRLVVWLTGGWLPLLSHAFLAFVVAMVVPHCAASDPIFTIVALCIVPALVTHYPWLCRYLPKKNV
ncbi:hypothetical protein DIPPA_18682 [Diplonema papillatum]|nr:hypothetical protein DIPPA_18682 [Diplonema papillatum]